MARGSVSIEDYLEDKIKSYMKLNKIKTKNKAINEIISTFFEYEKVFQNIKDLDKKIEMINNLHKKYSNKIFNVIISRKCENLPRL